MISSFPEDLPKAVCEAMLHGLPSIGFSDCPGADEVVISGRTGLLVNRQWAIDSLARGLAHLMANADLRAAMGDAAFRLSAPFADRKKAYDHWEDLFRRVCGYKGNCDRLLEEQKKIDSTKAAQCLRLRKALLSATGLTPAVRTEEQVSPHSPIVVRNRAMPLVSVVVPLYNKEDYVRETLCSIVADQYPNKEVIVIDDASTDRSGEIVEEIAKDWKHVAITRLPSNVGLSGARNAGLSLAKGEFIHFWDADDIYANGALASVIEIMLLDDCDIATGLAHRGGSLLGHYSKSSQLCRRTNFLANPTVFTTSSCCFKIYSKSFLDRYKLTFVDRLYMQDSEFNFRAFVQADCVSMTPYVLGDYRRVENSSSRIFSLARMQSAIHIDQLTRSFLMAEDQPEFESQRQSRVMLFTFLFFIRRLVGHEPVKDAGDHTEMTERFRSIVARYGEGIVELSRTHPRLALLLIAFGSGRDDVCRRMWADGPRMRASYLGELVDNSYGFSIALLREIYERHFFVSEQEESGRVASRLGPVKRAF